MVEVVAAAVPCRSAYLVVDGTVVAVVADVAAAVNSDSPVSHWHCDNRAVGAVAVVFQGPRACGGCCLLSVVDTAVVAVAFVAVDVGASGRI